MPLLHLCPTIPLDTPKGPADARPVIDYGCEAPLPFVVFVRATGECRTLDGRTVRLETNLTTGVRGSVERPAPAAAG